LLSTIIGFMNGQYSWLTVVISLIAYAALLLIMLPVHECSHAAVAYWLGDSTAKWSGRLTLNPMKHLDPLGAVMLVLFGFGYAKPVPVNPYRFTKVSQKTGMALTALAGPVSNLLMAFLSLLIYKILTLIPLSSTVLTCAYVFFVYVLAEINIGLAVFNLIPVTPLDGSRILGAFLPDRVNDFLNRYSRYFVLILFALIWAGMLSVPLNYLRNLIFYGFCWILGLS